MRIIKYKKPKVTLMINYVLSLWSVMYFRFSINSLLYFLNINIVLLGFQFCLLIKKAKQ
jgi:hypothetical protein